MSYLVFGGKGGEVAAADDRNFIRRKSDYCWIAAFYVILWWLGEQFGGRSTAKDRDEMYRVLNYFELPSVFWCLVCFSFVTASALFGTTVVTWGAIMAWNPKTPTAFFHEQLKNAYVNFVLLGVVQSIWEYLSLQGITRLTFGRASPALLLWDTVFWMLTFELTWYAQHRLMHDSKTLWKYGHQYHHGWKKPEHMIGITNFAFDHVVEVWVTMSSSFLPVILFPANFYLNKIVGLLYSVFAVCAHWDGFPIRYHLNHHYLVTQNYGSHIPIFDMLFGTYRRGDFYPAGSLRGKAD